jgi:predicted branched-subunit amino acid permease
MTSSILLGMTQEVPGREWDSTRRGVIRDALGIGLATGAYGLSFGAIATASGLTVLQACALSLLMFTGASQFALAAVVGGGGSAFAGAATATLIGSRNALYGLRLSPLLRVTGIRKLVAAQLVIDESTAMAIGKDDPDAARLGFWATGLAVFVLWNIGTLLGAVGAQAVSDPAILGLDAAVPAAFLALLAPHVKERSLVYAAVVAAAVAVVAVPLVPAGVPVLCAAVVALFFGLRTPQRTDG